MSDHAAIHAIHSNSLETLHLLGHGPPYLRPNTSMVYDHSRCKIVWCCQLKMFKLPPPIVHYFIATILTMATLNAEDGRPSTMVDGRLSESIKWPWGG